MVRALFASYAGPLYAVRRASDNTTKAIPVLVPGGYADASAQVRAPGAANLAARAQRRGRAVSCK